MQFIHGQGLDDVIAELHRVRFRVGSAAAASSSVQTASLVKQLWTPAQTREPHEGQSSTSFCHLRRFIGCAGVQSEPGH